MSIIDLSTAPRPAPLSGAPAVIRAADLAKMLGVARVTLWRWSRKGHLPLPIKLGPGVTGWRRADIELWLAQRPTA